MKGEEMWSIQPHTTTDKSFVIEGPIALQVDYDDVPHEEVDAIAVRIANCLNDHWDEDGMESWLRDIRKKYGDNYEYSGP